MKNISFLLLGIFFGIVMFKSEAASYFRIYEMFQFKSFHMYGIMGTALAWGVTGIYLIKRLDIKSFGGTSIRLQDKDKSYPRAIIGGIIFGLGWALSGLCPGPMFTMMGAGYLPVVIVFLSALFGTFCYGAIREKLPH
jgi:uncharacterized membrane protein YedE/YeeE